MALVLSDRVKETCSSPGTGTVSLLGAQTGFQAFSTGVGNGNTCYYTIADQSGTHWEVGIGTYSSTGNTLTRTTPLSGSATTPVNFSSGTQDVFVTYPAEKAIFKDSNNIMNWNNEAPAYTNTVTAAGTTTLTATSTYYQHFSGSTTQTLQMPNATTLPQGIAYVIDNDSSGTVTITSNGGSTLYTVPSGCAGFMYLMDNSTSNGTWGGYSFIPGAGPTGEAYWSTSGPNLGGGTISNGSWNGSTIGVGYGGTGLSSTPTNGQLLIGNGSGFTESTLTAGTGISVTNGSGSISIANTGVTSVTGTAPVVSSGGTTPAISMPVATSSANGYLASTDWTTFNNKSPAAGSTSITTLGTITTGTWNGTVLSASYGGTGEAGTLTGILYGNGTSAFTVATTAQLLSGIGTLPVANGGTGLTSLTAGYIPYGNGTSAFSSSSTLTYNGTTLSAGNFVPSSSTTPTNGMYLGSANQLTFATNSTYAMLIDSLQQVYIGTGSGNTTSNKLTIYGDGGVAASPVTGGSYTGALGVCILGTTISTATSALARLYMTGNNSAHAGCLDLRSGSVVSSTLNIYDTGGTQRVLFSPTGLQYLTNTSAGYASAIVNAWGNSSNPGVLVGTTQTSGTAFQVGTGIATSGGLPSSVGTTAFAVFGSGGVSIGNTTDPGSGNLRFNTTSSNGIYFGSSSQLNDYEQGTWTPIYTATGTNPTVTYSIQTGYYTKIGNLVYIVLRIALSAASGGSGNLIISGLPYNQSSGNAYPGSSIQLYKSNNTSETAITVSNIGSSTDFIMSACYSV
jgi:hypothetical protein